MGALPVFGGLPVEDASSKVNARGVRKSDLA